MKVKLLPKRITEYQKSKILRMYNVGIENKKIAMILGCTPSQVYHFLYKSNLNIKLRTKSWTLNDAKKIEKLYMENKMSSNQIALRLGVDGTKLRSFMRSIGKPISELRKKRRL